MKLVFNLLLMFTLIFTYNSTFAQKRSKLHEPASKGDLATVKEVIASTVPALSGTITANVAPFARPNKLRF